MKPSYGMKISRPYLKDGKAVVDISVTKLGILVIVLSSIFRRIFTTRDNRDE